jgi:beta-mannosidase
MCGWQEYIDAVAPGSVYNDLLANKKMEDPFWRDNEDKAFPLMENDFEYICAFVAEDEFFAQKEILLRCNGLDTLADIYLNGAFIGKADNMHRVWEFGVKSQLVKGENALKIVFHSPNQFVRKAYAENRVDGSSDALDGFPLLRKAHCMFGWDWGPRLPDAGIWRDIELIGIAEARINNVYIAQTHKNGAVALNFRVEIDFFEEFEKKETEYAVLITGPDGKSALYDRSPETVEIKNPALWMPNGYGSQPLYTVKVLLSRNGRELDSWERRIGLRTLTVRREKDQWGESFAFEVNGSRIFAMGADYIPEDNILSRVKPERTRLLLEHCVSANFNSIRVWGGGYYPDDFFFDICDELGLIVWHDFMFACAVYRLSEEFEENIRAELIDNIKRIRHHASLGLWCGNNEMEDFVDKGVWVGHPSQKADYIKMFEYVFPKILKEYDPQTFYWPSSPSSGGSFDKAQDPSRGDVHYWEVWHGNKPFSDYRNYYFRFLSEFGFQSFPCLKTVERFTLPEDRNVFSYIMEKHQRNAAANGKILGYLYQTFLYPNDFDTLIYASQLLQAEAIKYGVEHFRRNRGRCMGAVYWQLNDCWPVASWASIDYFGRWKALHYFAKRFFAPLMISCAEEGMLTQDAGANVQPQVKAAMKKSFRLSVANETLSAKNVLVKWEIRDKNAHVLREESAQIAVAPLSSQWLDSIETPDLALFDEYISYHLFENGVLRSEGTVILSLPKYFHYADPKLTYSIEGNEIIVKASAYAKSVEIQNKDQDFILSDNYFDMNAGEKRVKILSGKPEGVKARSVFDIK